MPSAVPRPCRREFRIAAACLLVLLAPALAATASAGQQQVFLKLTDTSGNPVTDLRPEEVQVIEDGMPRQVTEAQMINWPTRLTLLVDNGPGTTAALSQLRNGLNGFLEALSDDIEVSLYTLNPQPRRIVQGTTDRADLLEGINRIAPDTGAARFFEGIDEATKRIDDQDSEQYPVIMVVASDGPEGSRVIQRDVQRMAERIGENRIQLHVAMLSLGGQRASATSGLIQVELGLQLTQFTRGRYENIAASSRLETLLPEFGEMISTAHEAQRSQYLLTYERPSGAEAPTQGISVSTSRTNARANLSLTGHISP